MQAPPDSGSRPSLGILICPRCGQGSLRPHGVGLECVACGATYPRENGFLSLLRDPDDRFDDVPNGTAYDAEEATNAATAKDYYLPLFRDFAGRLGTAGRPLRVLCCGCGVGSDVDVFCAHGLDAWGIDCGRRTERWSQRRERDRLIIANAKALPFADASFDVVKTDCFLPHVGVVGDSAEVRPDYLMQRLTVARELGRIVRPGGMLIMANPNRRCPFDLFHRGQMRLPGGLVRLHRPSEPFLLSFDDYRDLFVAGAGCASIETLPPERFWSFQGASAHPVRRFLVAPLRAYFALLSRPITAALRATALNPWLIVAVVR